MLMACFRDSDIVARIDLDTFCVLLAGTDLDGVDPARYRLEEQLSARNREDGYDFDLVVEAHAVAYKPGRHGQKGLVRLVERLVMQ